MKKKNSKDDIILGPGYNCSYIDITYTEEKEGPICTKLNVSSLLGSVSFLSMLSVPAAAEGGAYIMAFVLLVIMVLCAYSAIKEDGKTNRSHH